METIRTTRIRKLTAKAQKFAIVYCQYESCLRVCVTCRRAHSHKECNNHMCQECCLLVVYEPSANACTQHFRDKHYTGSIALDQTSAAAATSPTPSPASLDQEPPPHSAQSLASTSPRATAAADPAPSFLLQLQQLSSDWKTLPALSSPRGLPTQKRREMRMR